MNLCTWIHQPGGGIAQDWGWEAIPWELVFGILVEVKTTSNVIILLTTPSIFQKRQA